MHTKNELENMSLEELTALAQSIGATVSKTKTDIIYNIIDQEASTGAQVAPEAQARKKTQGCCRRRGEKACQEDDRKEERKGQQDH